MAHIRYPGIRAEDRRLVEENPTDLAGRLPSGYDPPPELGEPFRIRGTIQAEGAKGAKGRAGSAARDKRCGDGLSGDLSSQCRMPSTLAAVPLIRSNFAPTSPTSPTPDAAATSGSTGSRNARYRDRVAAATIATAWSRSSPAERAVRVTETHASISAADRDSVPATSRTGP